MLKPIQHQAAGHEGSLTDEDGGLFIKKTTPQEIDFYNQILHLDHADSDEVVLGSKLSHWMPVCFGKLNTGIDAEHADKIDMLVLDETAVSPAAADATYLVLQNLYNLYSLPSIVDIKLGSKLTDDSVTHKDKIDRLAKVARETTSSSHHFRICGMKLYNGSDSKPQPLYNDMNDSVHVVEESNLVYLQFDKMFGRSLDSTTIEKGIELFFSPFKNMVDADTARLIIYRLLSQYLKRLQLVYNCFLDYEIRLFSASLLFIYETDLKKWNVPVKGPVSNDHFLLDDDKYDTVDPIITEFVIEDEEDEEDVEKESSLSRLNLIDLAHAKLTPGQGQDENVLQGIENLITLFESLVSKYKPEI